MSRTFIGIITAATMIITSLNAAPARAGNNDIAKFLVGATALFIIGTAIKDSKRSRAPQSPQPPRSNPGYNDEPAWHSHSPNGRSYPGALPSVKRSKHLPSSCLSNYRTSEGKRSYFAPDCLQKRYRQSSYLPNNCKKSVWTAKGLRVLYKPSCLRNAGFRWSAG